LKIKNSTERKMSKEEARRSAITNFIMKICSLERYIEVKRQMLCDKTDFEPYVAFQRLARNGQNGITSANINQYLSENLIDLSLSKCRNILNHYDSDLDGLLSYKEFLELVLPKEHPELRAYVTQRQCFDIHQEEYLSYETEAAMAVLMSLEIKMFEEAHIQKEQLDKMGLSGHTIVEIIDEDPEGNLNFNNIQRYLTESGLMPYDSEIINFLRRVDRDDDGVITGEEFMNFLTKFDRTHRTPDPKRELQVELNQTKLECFSPGRKIVSNTVSLIPFDGDNQSGPAVQRRKATDQRKDNRPIPQRKSRIRPQIDSLAQESTKIRISRKVTEKNIIKSQSQIQTKIQPIQSQIIQKQSLIQVGQDKSIQNQQKAKTIEELPQEVSGVREMDPNQIKKETSQERKVYSQVKPVTRIRGDTPTKYERYQPKADQTQKYDTFGQNRKPISPMPPKDKKVLQELNNNTINRAHMPPKDKIGYVKSKKTQDENNRSYVVTKVNRVHTDYSQRDRVYVQQKENYTPKSTLKGKTELNKSSNQTPQKLIIEQKTHDISQTQSRISQKSQRPSITASQRPSRLNLPQQPMNDLDDKKDNPPTNRSQLALNRSRERLRRSQFQKIPKRIYDKKTVVVQQDKKSITQTPVSQSNIHHSTLQMMNPNSSTMAINRSPHSQRQQQSNQRVHHQDSHIRRDTVSTTAGHTVHPAPSQIHDTSLDNLTQMTQMTQQMDQSQISIRTKKSGRSKSRRRRKKSGRSPSNKNKRKKRGKSKHRSPRNKSKKRRVNKVFFNYLADLIFDERDLEESRRRLVSRKDFSAKEMFKLVDKRGVGRFSFEEFREFLTEIGVNYTDTRSISDLYCCLNSNENCLLGYDDLVLMISSRDQSYASLLHKHDPGRPYQGLSQETITLMADCFNKLFSSRKLLIEAKMAFREEGIELHETFEEIDIEAKGYLIHNDFLRYLQRRRPDFQESDFVEIGLFLENCDMDRDGKVSFKDFYMFFSG